MISKHDVLFYRNHGYLVVNDVLDSDFLNALRDELDTLVAGAAQVTAHNKIYDLEESHSTAQPRVRRIKAPHTVMPSVARLARDPKLVSILTALLGPGVRLQTSKLNMKSAEYGAAVEWHQDWAFYPHTNDDLLAVGVFLDDMTEQNGPLQIIPGSHQGPIHDHHSDGYFCGAINPQTSHIDFTSAATLTGPAGSISFHHVRAIHGSALNYSEQTRRLLLYQFTAVDAWPLIESVTDIDAYNDMIIAGEATLAPRLTQVPVRLPLPPAPHQGSIYENQRIAKQRFFDCYNAS